MNYQDHATNITRRLVDMIQTGSHGQWAMPWHTHDLGDLLNARNATTDSRYNGANVLTLAIEALERGYPTGEWATYKQWTDHGAQVRKGERSAHVIKWVTRKTRTDDQPASGGDSREVRQLLPRVYSVFNAHQVDGHDAQPDTAPATPPMNGSQRSAQTFTTAQTAPTTTRAQTGSTSPPPTSSTISKRSTPPTCTNTSTGPATPPASTGSTSTNPWTHPSTRPRNSSPSSAPRLVAPASASARHRDQITPPTSRTGSHALNADPKQLFRSAAAHNEPSTTSTNSPTQPATRPQHEPATKPRYPFEPLATEAQNSTIGTSLNGSESAAEPCTAGPTTASPSTKPTAPPSPSAHTPPTSGPTTGTKPSTTHATPAQHPQRLRHAVPERSPLGLGHEQPRLPPQDRRSRPPPDARPTRLPDRRARPDPREPWRWTAALRRLWLKTDRPTSPERLADTPAFPAVELDQALRLPPVPHLVHHGPLSGLVSGGRGMSRRHPPPGPRRRNHFARNHSALTGSPHAWFGLARPRTKKSRPYGLRRRSTPAVVTPEHPDHQGTNQKQGDTEMNNVTLVGRLATEPRLEATNGNPICTFRLAVDRGKHRRRRLHPHQMLRSPSREPPPSTSPKAA